MSSAGREDRLRGEVDIVLQVLVKILFRLVGVVVRQLVREACLPVRLIIIRKPVCLVQVCSVICFHLVLVILLLLLLLRSVVLALPKALEPDLDGFSAKV